MPACIIAQLCRAALDVHLTEQPVLALRRLLRSAARVPVLNAHLYIGCGTKLAERVNHDWIGHRHPSMLITQLQ